MLPRSKNARSPRSSVVALLPLLLFVVPSVSSGCSRAVATTPGAVTFLIETMPANLDPRVGTDAQSQRIDGLIFSGLVERDEQMNLRGDLAESWETPDSLTYIFHLKRGVRFHDGRLLTSADVKYTFDSILSGAIPSPKRGSFRMVRAIDAPDASTVIFHLSEPYASFLWSLARPAVGIVPGGAGADFAQHPVGTGPFEFVSAKQDDEVVLDRNADYFGRPAKISRVRFRVVPEAIVRALELRKGTADLELNSLAADMVPVMKREPSIEVTEQPGTIYAYVAFNLDDAKLASRDVRQALAYATDREQIIRYLLRGQARTADEPLPPNSWAYDPDISRYSFDPARAEWLLDAAGFPRRPENGGMRLTLTLKTSTEESVRLLGAVLREQWRRVGVDLELRPLEFATLYSDITRGNFELYTLRWVGANNDPDIFEYIFSSTKMPPAGANRGHYRNAGLDALIDQARVEGDRAKRRKLFGAIQKIITEDEPYLSLWFADNVCVHRTRISNIHLTPSGDYDFLRDIEAK